MRIGGVMRTRLITALPTETAAAAIDRMVEAGIGATLVLDGYSLAGIFTERDVLRLARDGSAFEELVLQDVMTRNPVTIAADDDILAAAQLMGERNVRHLPVVEGGNVVGIVSIRDVLGFLVERLWEKHDAAARETAHALLKRR